MVKRVASVRQRISITGKLNSGGDQKGFTLVELLVVCALISIMLSFGVASLKSSFFTDPLKSSARKIVGLVGGVRELAVRSQQPYFIHLSRLENRLWYERDGSGEEEDKEEKRQLRLPEGISIREVQLALAEVSLIEPVSLWITKQGYMQETRIQLEDGKGKHISLQFFPFIDTVQVSEPSVLIND